MSRSAVPVAWVIWKSTSKPWRFSIRACPRYDNLAPLPFPFRANRASGSVVLAWVALDRRSPRKSTVGLPGSSGTGSGARGPSVRRKLFRLAAASISVPSTVKC